MAKSKARDFFGFNRKVKEEIGLRQNCRCAVCGTDLGRGNTEIRVNYHHVVPVQSGNPADPSHGFMSTADNGVLLCDESDENARSESCHGLVAHGQSRFASFNAFAQAFPFSHDEDKAAHRAWVRALNKLERSVYAPPAQ